MSKQTVITGFRVEVDPPHHVTRWCQTEEAKEKALKDWASDFHDFIRDHRSQDPLRLEVIREEREECSHCGREWEEDKDGPLCCRDAQGEWDAAKANGATA